MKLPGNETDFNEAASRKAVMISFPGMQVFVRTFNGT